MQKDRPYKLALLKLRCLRVQESDGDETYIKLNGRVVWSWRGVGRKMHHAPRSEQHTDAFDFRTCKFHDGNRWFGVSTYEPGDFVFRELTGPVAVQLWESDEGNLLRGADDLLGEVNISPGDIRTGEHAVTLAWSNAVYTLTYHVGRVPLR